MQFYSAGFHDGWYLGAIKTELVVLNIFLYGVIWSHSQLFISRCYVYNFDAYFSCWGQIRWVSRCTYPGARLKAQTGLSHFFGLGDTVPSWNKHGSSKKGSWKINFPVPCLLVGTGLSLWTTQSIGSMGRTVYLPILSISKYNHPMDPLWEIQSGWIGDAISHGMLLRMIREASQECWITFRTGTTRWPKLWTKLWTVCFCMFF